MNNPKQSKSDSGEGVKSGHVRELEIAWEEKQQEVDSIVDRLGEPIDSNIRETIVAFHMSELPTSGSCEGHNDHGNGAPWVEMEALNEPEWRFENEAEVYIEIANKSGVSFEQLKKEDWEKDDEVLKEFWNKLDGREETKEYKDWRQENIEIERSVKELLEDFYKNREVPSDVGLRIEHYEAGNIVWVHNGGDGFTPEHVLINEEDSRKITLNLRRYQEEMQAFTQFLKDRYFEGAIE